MVRLVRIKHDVSSICPKRVVSVSRRLLILAWVLDGQSRTTR